MPKITRRTVSRTRLIKPTVTVIKQAQVINQDVIVTNTVGIIDTATVGIIDTAAVQQGLLQETNLVLETPQSVATVIVETDG